MESDPCSPKSPSPKVSPGSKSPSPHLLEIDQPHQKKFDPVTSSECGEIQVSEELAQLQEAEKELSDEMIIKEDPFLSPIPVQDIKTRLDDEVSSHPECKDVVTCSDKLVNPLDSSVSLNSNTSFPYSENICYEMPSGQQQEEEAYSTLSSGFAATDSKDSLDVQVHSVVEDFSELMSGREESLDDIKHQHAASIDDSEDGQHSKDDDVGEDFEMIQEFEVDETRYGKKEAAVESMEKVEIEVGGSSQMQDVMEIFEKIENESVIRNEETGKQVEHDVNQKEQKRSFDPNENIDIFCESSSKSYKFEILEQRVDQDADNKEAPGVSLKTVTAKIEKFVENQDEIIATNAYVTTGSFEGLEPYDIDSHALVFTPGVLKINIIQASGLVNQDFVGKSDPYVIVKYNDQVHRSVTVQDNLDPVWNFSVDLEVNDADSDILIEVYDDDFGRDNFEGELTLKVADLLQHTEQEPILYSLKGCKSGKILVSSSYSTSVVSVPDTHNVEVVAIENVRPSSQSSSSSSSEKLEQRKKFVAETSTDSSVSTKQESTIKKLHHQDTVEENDSLALDTQKEKKISSDESSDTEDEKRDANISSSDYDSSVHAPTKGNRPESFISDNSSDYDSLSDVGRRRPQSFALDDEYEVISEEEANESESKIIGHKEDHIEAKEDQKKIATEQASLVPVVGAEKKQEGDNNKQILTDLDGISVHNELFSSSLTSTHDLHADESSISVVVAQSLVSSSNALADTVDKNLENISFSSSHAVAGLDNSNPLDPQGIG
jgi:C2 domain